jgi:hypothetical protein
MIFTVTFKTPDVVSDAISKAIFRKYENSLEGIENNYYNCDIEDENIENLKDLKNKSSKEFYDMTKLADKFVSWGECITIEFDTEKQTATVLE